MNATIDPPRKPTSFKDSKIPSLAVELIDGRRYGWPLHSLSGWEFKPLSAATEAGADVLTIEAGRHLVEMRGTSLRAIADVLDQGGGGFLCEVGPHFRALVQGDAPFIESIRVEECVTRSGSGDPA